MAPRETILDLYALSSCGFTREGGARRRWPEPSDRIQNGCCGQPAAFKGEGTLQVPKSQPKSQHLSTGQSWAWDSSLEEGTCLCGLTTGQHLCPECLPQVLLRTFLGESDLTPSAWC